MLISYKWLTELVPTDLNASVLGERLTLTGLEIDGVHEKGDDVIFDIEVTSNRGDCLSHFGVAREVSAFTGAETKFPGALEDSPSMSERVHIDDPGLCRRFTSRIIRGVKVGPSPVWLVEKLEAVGERSINNIADITNYVMHELGQPMHSFDLDKLVGQKLVVRRAHADESITTLDEVERKLNDTMLAICDTERAVAVAGIMGGFQSGITGDSTNVLLEVAYFERESIRNTSRELGLSTEASYRFERGVDIDNLIGASNRATELICELAGGTADEFTDVYPEPIQRITIKAESVAAETLRLTGIAFSDDQVNDILGRLGIEKTGADTYSVPTWRHDLAIPEDLVEEVIRVHGYDKIGESIPESRGAGEYHQSEPRKRKARAFLAATGFTEAISYSFVDAGAASLYTGLNDLGFSKAQNVLINDPIIEGADLMRSTLLPGIVEAANTNFRHKEKNLKIFEIGRIFQGSDSIDALPEESESIAFMMSGREIYSGSAVVGREFDFFDLKAVVESAAESLGARKINFAASDDVKHLQPGQSAFIECDGRKIGTAGKLNSDIASSYKFKQPVYIAEINLSVILEAPESVSVYKPLDAFPSIIRDVSLVVSNETHYSRIIDVIGSGDFEYFEGTTYVDTYSGSGISDDERSITIRLEYRSQERTLTDEEVDTVHAAVLSALETELNARFR